MLTGCHLFDLAAFDRGLGNKKLRVRMTSTCPQRVNNEWSDTLVVEMAMIYIGQMSLLLDWSDGMQQLVPF